MRRVLRAIVIAAGAFSLAVVGLTAVFSRLDPPLSALMLWRLTSGHGIHYRPVPIAAIAPELIHAVLTSEDNRFCEHDGIDWREVGIVIDQAGTGDGPPRGASTITMQAARNLFLWPDRSYVRKALEVPIGLTIDALWSKRRILEVYLNIAEWGPGIYGAETAAGFYFDRPAARLTRAQATLLAAALPAPLLRNAARPGPVTRRAASLIDRRMAQTRGLFSCVGQ